jgi:hypothetical protein
MPGVPGVLAALGLLAVTRFAAVRMVTVML